jgi:voltage-gated sodium channel
MRGIARGLDRLVGSSAFEYTTLGVILANAVVLGLETYDYWERRAGGAFDTLNTVFLAYFTVEMAIRLLAHGTRPQRFFRSGWNTFDFAVVASAYLPGVRESTTALRVIRLLRVFRLVSVLPEMRVLVRGMARSVAPLGSVAILTLILFYVYAMLGWIFFGDHDPERWGTVGEGMLTLFSVLTLEEWTVIQREAREVSDFAWVYFVSFVLLTSFILLNMVIAVVINSVEDARALVAKEESEREREALAAEDQRHAEVLGHIDALRAGVDAIEAELARQRQALARGEPGSGG